MKCLCIKIILIDSLILNLISAIMKKIYVLLGLMLGIICLVTVKSFANGTSPLLALNYSISDTSNPVDCIITNNDSSYWIKIHTDSAELIIENQLPDINHSKISGFTLYTGSPGNLIVDTTFTFNSTRDSSVLFVMNNLTKNSDYYLKIISYQSYSTFSINLYYTKPSLIITPCQAAIGCGPELLINGDFEQTGSPTNPCLRYPLQLGVTSQLGFLCNNAVFQTNNYCIWANTAIPPFVAFADHSPSATGFYFWADSPVSATSTGTAWEQDNIAVIPNNPYVFNMWSRSLNLQSSSAPATLMIYVDEIDLSSISTSKLLGSFNVSTQGWSSNSFCFTTDPLAVSLNLRIVCVGGGGPGFDFGLDDLSLRSAVVEPPQVTVQPCVSMQPCSVIVSNPIVGSMYTWYIPNPLSLIPGISCLNNQDCSSVAFTPTSPGVTYAVYCSSPSCGVNFTTFNVPTRYITSCCLNADQYIQVSNTNINTIFPLNSTIWVGKNVKLIVSSSYNLINNHIYFEHGAEIIIQQGGKLNLNGTHLQGCSNMWNGITIQSGGELTTSNNTMIEDAIQAISAENGSIYTIHTTILNKNYRGLFINNMASHSGSVYNSIFTCREISHGTSVSSLKANNNLATLTTSSISDPFYYFLNGRSRSGVEILSVYTLNNNPMIPSYNIRIGEPGQGISKANIFDNLMYGILTTGSNVEIENNIFQNMPGGFSNGYPYGCGVFGYSTKALGTKMCDIKIGGILSENEKNTFNAVGFGIYLKNYRGMVIQKNIMTTPMTSQLGANNYYARYGILMHTNSDVSIKTYISCIWNNIANYAEGIFWNRLSNNKVNVDISWNNISGYNGSSSASLFCNTAINLKSVTSNTDRPDSYISILKNDITNVREGIVVEGFKENFYALNSLLSEFNIADNFNIGLKNGQTSGGNLYSGIRLNFCKNIIIHDNPNIYSNSHNYQNLSGISLIHSDQNAITCNNIHDIGNAVSFDGNCVGISDGVLHNNTFTNYTNAVSISSSGIIGDQGTTFRASDNKWYNPGTWAHDVQNFNNLFPIFYTRNPSTPYKPVQSSFQPNYCAICSTAVNNSGSNTSGITCGGNNYSLSSTILGADELNFIRKLANNDITFPVLALELKWLFGSSLYEKLMRDTTISPNDTIVLDFIDSLENGNIGRFYDVATSIQNEAWTQAEIDNNSITHQNHIEENLKEFNYYYIAYHNDTTLSEDSTWIANMAADLTPIASECLKVGGPAVLSARALLAYFTGSTFEENEECYRIPMNSIIVDTTNSSCDLIKNYSVSSTSGATYTWNVPIGTTYTQTVNSISVNWGSLILSGGTITCAIMDSLGNTATGSYTEDTLITSPTCVTVTANNTSCVSATSLSWNSPDGCTAGYYIWLGTNGGGTTTPDNVIDSLDIGNDTIYMLPFLQPGITYYYKVVPYNNSHTTVSGCSIGSFTSGSSVAYTPTLGNPYQENFDGVTAPALPCGMTVSNENFPQDNFVWETSSSASCSGNNSMAIAKNPNNSTAKNDWVYSHPLNLTAGELYRVKYKRKAQAGFTENLTTYMSTNPDAATMLTTSALSNSSIATTSCGIDSGDFISPTSSKFFVGLHANSNANQSTIFVDDLNVSLIKTTHLKPAKCGINYNTCDRIECETYTGATSYKFKFEDLSNSFSSDYVVSSSNPYIYQFFQGSNPLILGRTYTVFVAASNGGGVWSPFGSGCEVYINPVPIRSLTGASCGDTLSDLSQLIYTNTSGICLISNYKYEFTDQSNNTIIETERNSAVTSFLMTYITTPYVKYSTTYSVRVKLKIGNTWGEYGSACYITTPASPLTKLSNAYCNYTLPTFATPVTCISVLGAQDYRYKITGPNSYDRTFTRNSSLNNWYFTWTNSSPYMQASTTYDVKVASRAGGVWSDYGDVCTITTPATLSRLADTTFLQKALQPIFDQLENSENELSLSVLPNPNNFEEKFSIELGGITESNQKVKFSILNMVGASVFRSDIITIDENRVLIQPEIRLASGLYIVEADLNGIKLWRKFVVQ